MYFINFKKYVSEKSFKTGNLSYFKEG